MDPLTQGLVGAALPQCFASRETLRRASVTGFAAGCAADLDILIRSSEDPLLFLDFHRHFSHSLIFIPLGGLIAAIPMYFLLWRQLSFRKTVLFAILGYATHGLLDACTSYGTQLLWPFSSARIAWNNVAVVDFFFTLPLAVLVLTAFIRKRALWARMGLALGLIYLLFGVVQRNRAEAFAENQATLRGHQPIRLEAKPTLGNLWLWRTIYHDGNHFYVDGLWTLPGFRSVWYEGSRSLVLDPQRDFPDLQKDSVQSRDLVRFTHFSDGFVALHPKIPGVVGDIRYALLPHQTTPLWGITINPERPQHHVTFHNFRDVNEQTWIQFWNMLRRQPL